MNSKSLNLIEEVITSFGMWDSLEIAQDSIYLEFSDVELGNPKYNDSLNLSFRFSDKSFIVFFYNNIWDAEFLANFDFKNHFINEDFVLKVEKIKDPVFVASKNFFNQSGEIIGCPILGESTESPLHIYVEMDENKGYIQCEQMKMLDLRIRGYKIIDRVKRADVINVTDAIQSIFDYI